MRDAWSGMHIKLWYEDQRIDRKITIVFVSPICLLAKHCKIFTLYHHHHHKFLAVNTATEI